MTRRLNESSHSGEQNPSSSPEKIRRLDNGFRDLQQFVEAEQQETVKIVDLDRCPAFVAEVPPGQLANAINFLRHHRILAEPSGDNTIAGYFDTPEKQQIFLSNQDLFPFVVYGLPGPNSYSRARLDRLRGTVHLSSSAIIGAYRSFHTQTDRKAHHDDPTDRAWYGRAFYMPSDQADLFDTVRELFPSAEEDPDAVQQQELASALKETKLLEQPLDQTYFDKHQETMERAFAQIPDEAFEPLTGDEVVMEAPAVRKVDIDHFSKTYRHMYSMDTTTFVRNETYPEEYLELVATYFDKLEDYLQAHVPQGITFSFSQRLGDAIYIYAQGGGDQEDAQFVMENLINDFTHADTGAAPFSIKHIPMIPQSLPISAIVRGDRVLVSDDLYDPNIVAEEEDTRKTENLEDMFDNASFTQYVIDTFKQLDTEHREQLAADREEYTHFIQSLRRGFFSQHRLTRRGR